MAECLTCTDSYTVEELLNLVTVCSGDSISSIRVFEVEDYETGFFDCLTYKTVEEIFRLSLYCEDDVFHVQVQVNDVDAASCAECADSLTTEELIRLCTVYNGGKTAFNVVVAEYESDCATCGTYRSIDDFVRGSVVCDGSGNYYFRIVAMEE